MSWSLRATFSIRFILTPSGLESSLFFWLKYQCKALWQYYSEKCGQMLVSFFVLGEIVLIPLFAE